MRNSENQATCAKIRYINISYFRTSRGDQFLQTYGFIKTNHFVVVVIIKSLSPDSKIIDKEGALPVRLFGSKTISHTCYHLIGLVKRCCF